MYKNEQRIRHLLDRARKQLIEPMTENQQRLLLVVNVTYLVLSVIFLISEWAATGNAVPTRGLGYVHIVVGVINAVSALHYAFWKFIIKRNPVRHQQTEKMFRWVSLLSIMLLSFCVMVGYGNPSNDSLLTDFAFGHSLIILIAMLLGRHASLAWFLVVLGALFYVTFVQKGYSYQYNYLTKSESKRYETALMQQRPWALQRQDELAQAHLNPPKASRYFNTWFAFIMVAYFSAYFFTQSAQKLHAIIPAVAENMQKAVLELNRQEMQQLKDDEDRLLLRQEALNAELKNLKSQINPHFLFNTLNYFYIKSLESSEDLASSILMLSEIMEYSVRDNVDRVGLVEEIKHMKYFIELLQLRNNNKLCIDFSITGPVDKIQILPFLFIGVLENAFKHGNMLDPQHPLIIRIEASPPQLKFFSSNQKNRKRKVTSTKIGLTNTRRRLALTYQNLILTVEEDEESFSIKLVVDTNDLKENFSSHHNS